MKHLISALLLAITPVIGFAASEPPTAKFGIANVYEGDGSTVVSSYPEVNFEFTSPEQATSVIAEYYGDMLKPGPVKVEVISHGSQSYTIIAEAAN